MLDQTSSTYDSVIHKKVEGRLTLSDESLTFQPQQDGAATTSGNTISWSSVAKHQVSPASYPKSLLKVVLVDGKSNTYQLSSRPELERIRQDVTTRLQTFRSRTTTSSNSISSSISGKKRPHSETLSPTAAAAKGNGSKGSTAAAKTTTTLASFGELDPTALAVTRSSLLAANPTLRAQHQYLVQDTQTVTEEDFWSTHQDLLEEEYARISGVMRAGTSSLLQSHLQLLTGRVTLGVEEMRQIFILYPAVHKAYEEKVPLELSDEQFWRKYLESEYFHRDRGRIGAASRQSDSKEKKSKTGNKLSVEDQEARAAAVGTDDLFSRYDQKIRESTKKSDEGARKWGTKLAVGQFDLASTFETERGMLLEGPRDEFPETGDGKGAKVIQKYNRHWAMVMHPEDAVAGSDLMSVSRQSVDDVIPDDEDAKAGGGLDKDMRQLVGFAMSTSADANHALGIGLADSDEYEELTLKNIEAYYSGRATASKQTPEEEAEMQKRNTFFANSLVAKVNTLVAATRKARKETRVAQIEDAFPPAKLGKDLLSALTNKMAADSKTDSESLEVVNTLPEDFKKRLHSYFRRSSELLRHFFGLRKLAEAQGNNNSYNQKLQKIVTGMETVYREMDEMRKELSATRETGEIMRKMCLQIMDQLDWAFKLHREGSGGGGGGGFVTIESF